MRLFSTDSKVDALARAPLFHGLSRRELEQLAKVTEDLDVEAGKVLCREGETAREFFVIVDGEADVTKGGEHLTALSSGDFFGEIALIEHVPRTATVAAKTRMRFFVLTSRSFWSLIENQPEIERKILRALAQRLRPTIDDPTVSG